MFNISTDYYSLSLKSILETTSGDTVINGAFIDLYNANAGNNGTYVTPDGQTIDSVKVNSEGFDYQGAPESTGAGAEPIELVTDDTFSIDNDLAKASNIFTFAIYSSNEPKLTKDIKGYIYYLNGNYIVYIYANALGFNEQAINVRWKLDVTVEDITIGGMRDLIGYIRELYGLDQISEDDDIIPATDNEAAIDAIVDKISKYLRDTYVINKYPFIVNANTIVRGTNGILLEIKISSEDNFKTKRSIVRINTEYSRYAQTFDLKVTFDNVLAPPKFKYVADGVDPYVEEWTITEDEADMFVRKLLDVISNISDYSAILD